MFSEGLDWVDGEELSLVKKRRPSFEGWVRAERMEEMWCRTGDEDSLCRIGVGLVDGVVDGMPIWTA